MISLVSPAFTVSLSSSSSIPRRIRAVFTLPYVLCSQRDAHSTKRINNLHKTNHFKPFTLPSSPPLPRIFFFLRGLGGGWGGGGGWGEGRPLLGSVLFPA